MIIGHAKRTAFTLTEVMVVISMLAILISLVLYAASGVGSSDALLRSQNHMREINQFMQNYTNSHDARIVPSQFDYLDEDDEAIGGPGSRLAYELTSNGSEWILNNNRHATEGDSASDLINRGTWVDLIWYDSNLDSILGMPDLLVDDWAGGGGDLYRSYKYAAPDRSYYEDYPRWEKNPLRSAVVNSWNWPRWDDSGNEVFYRNDTIGTVQTDGIAGLPMPLGTGAWQKNMPGFFAANNFFDSRSAQDVTGVSTTSTTDRYWTEGQIKAPSRSLLLVDSFAGETIGGTPGFLGSSEYGTQHDQYYEDTQNAFFVPAVRSRTLDGDSTSPPEGECLQQVDFRYGDNSCLMLFIDGHVSQEQQWGSLWDLEGTTGFAGRNIRILDLDKRRAQPIMHGDSTVP